MRSRAFVVAMVAALTACHERAAPTENAISEGTREPATLTSPSTQTDSSDSTIFRPDRRSEQSEIAPYQYPLDRLPPRRRPGDPVSNPAVRPGLIKSVAPDYSPEALKQRIQGIVILELVIERDGRVSSGRVLKPLPSGLTQKAIDAVKHWRYSPGRDERGNAVRCSLNVTVNFKLPDPKQ